MTLAHDLAERIHRIRYEDLTPTVLEWTRAAFVDTIAVTLVGINTDTAQIPRWTTTTCRARWAGIRPFRWWRR